MVGTPSGDRLDLVDDPRSGSRRAEQVAVAGQVGNEERVTRTQQTVQVTDVRLVVVDEVEVVTGRQVPEDQRVLLVGQSPQVESAVETDEDAVVEPAGEARRGKGDLGRSLTLGAGDGVLPRLEGHQRQDTALPNHPT